MTTGERLLDKSRLVFGVHLLVGLALAALGAVRIYFGAPGSGVINVVVGSAVAYLGYRLSRVV